MRNRTSPDNHDVDAKAIGVAQNMPPAPERTEALVKATQLRRAADTYEYLFSNELNRAE